MNTEGKKNKSPVLYYHCQPLFSALSRSCWKSDSASQSDTKPSRSDTTHSTPRGTKNTRGGSGKKDVVITVQRPEEDPSSYKTWVLGEDCWCLGGKSLLKIPFQVPRRWGRMAELQVPRENSQPVLPTSPVSSGTVGEAFGRRGKAKEQDLSYVPL